MIFVTTTGVFAQNEIASPYSRFGLGSMNTNKSNTALQGMAGLANSLDGKHMLNNSNPAAYAAIDSLTFLLDAGFYMRYSTFRTADQVEKGSDANFDFFDIGFGVTKWWKQASASPHTAAANTSQQPISNGCIHIPLIMKAMAV